MPSFFCNARYFLITYPQCGELSGDSVVDLFSSLGAECIVAREHHANGGVHLHVFADFGRKFRCRRTDVFDVEGFHPNIEPSRGTPEKGYDYAIKDGEVIAGGLARPECSRGDRGPSSFDKWTEITSAETRELFWELCHQLDPKSAACSFGQLAKYADWKFAPQPQQYATPSGIEFVGADVDGRDSWLQQSGIGVSTPHLGEHLAPSTPFRGARRKFESIPCGCCILVVKVATSAVRTSASLRIPLGPPSGTQCDVF